MRPSRFLSLMLVAWLLALGWGHTACAEQRLALVIDNVAYPNAPLSAPAGDARTLSKALRGLGFEVILRENLTKSQMETILDDFKNRLNPGSIAIFYYSGYAVQINGGNYLIPLDVDASSKGSVLSTAVAAKDILDDFATTQSHARLAIIDACRNAPLQRQLSGIPIGLAPMKVPGATIVAFSAAPGKIADDSGRYVTDLIKAMKTPGLPLSQMLQQVQAAVSAETNQAQIPWSVSSLTEAVTLTDAPLVVTADAPVTAPVRPPPPPLIAGAEAAEVALWLSIKDSKNPAAFQGYLTQYPAGRYVVMARNSLRLLQQKTALLVAVPQQPVPVFQPPSPAQQSYAAADAAEKKQYDHARALLRHGEATQAEEAFRHFVTDHRSSLLAANAQYWLAESLYVRGQFSDAAAAFAEEVSAFPKNPRIPESLLKLGLSQKVLARLDSSGRLDSGRKGDACKTFAVLAAQFPDAPEAVRAKAERTRLNCPAN